MFTRGGGDVYRSAWGPEEEKTRTAHLYNMFELIMLYHCIGVLKSYCIGVRLNVRDDSRSWFHDV